MLWQVNPFLTTTTTTQVGRGKQEGGVGRYQDKEDGLSNGRCMGIQR